MNLANKITVVRLLLIPIFLIFITPTGSSMLLITKELSLYIATGIFLLAAITDKLDGYIARKYNQVTKLGTLLDPLVDKLLISAALISLVENHKLGAWIALIIISREILVTSIRLAAIPKKIILAADRYGKIKLVFQVIAISLIMMNDQPFVSILFGIDQLMMFTAVGITVFSGVNYLLKNKSIFAG